MAEQANQSAQLAQMLAAGADPQSLIQQAQLQRKLDLANALTQQGMTPMDGTQMAGQVAIRNSPLQGIAKIAQILAGNSMANDLIKQNMQSRVGMVGNMQAPGQQPAQPAPNGVVPAQPVQQPQGLGTTSTGPAVQPALGGLPTYDPLPGYSPQQKLALYLADPVKFASLGAEANKASFERASEGARLAQESGGSVANASAAQINKLNQITPGVQMGPNGTAAPVPNYLEAVTSLEGAQKLAEARNAITYVKDENGREGPVIAGPAADAYMAQHNIPGPTTPATATPPAIIGQSSADATTQTGRANMANSYEEALSNRLSSGNQLMLRYQEMNNALDAMRTGGGSAARAHLAQIAQGLGAPTSLVDKLNGGDLSATQEFQKLAAQSAMANLRMSMDGKGAPAQSEFQTFEKNNPNIELDPRAIQKIFAFTNKLHANDLAEYSGYLNWKADGKNPADYPLHWSQVLTAKTNAPTANQPPDLMSAVQAEIARRKAANGR